MIVQIRTRTVGKHTLRRERKIITLFYFHFSAGWRKDGAGPSGVKNFENNNDHCMGFTEDYNAYHYNPQVSVFFYLIFIFRI